MNYKELPFENLNSYVMSQDGTLINSITKRIIDGHKYNAKNGKEYIYYQLHDKNNHSKIYSFRKDKLYKIVYGYELGKPETPKEQDIEIPKSIKRIIIEF